MQHEHFSPWRQESTVQCPALEKSKGPAGKNTFLIHYRLHFWQTWGSQPEDTPKASPTIILVNHMVLNVVSIGLREPFSWEKDGQADIDPLCCHTVSLCGLGRSAMACRVFSTRSIQHWTLNQSTGMSRRSKRHKETNQAFCSRYCSEAQDVWEIHSCLGDTYSFLI